MRWRRAHSLPIFYTEFGTRQRMKMTAIEVKGLDAKGTRLPPRPFETTSIWAKEWIGTLGDFALGLGCLGFQKANDLEGA